MKPLFIMLALLLAPLAVEAADTTRLVGTTCEVFVNRFPLTDADEQITTKDSVAYDEAGMDLVWYFETPGGEITAEPVTPVIAGDYLWTNRGAGMYSITRPKSIMYIH